MWDTIVIGAGPGGVSAAIWAYRLGLTTLLVDARDRIGGQLLELHGKVVDYPGLPVEKGHELAPRFARHLESLSVTVRLATPVVEISATGRSVATRDGDLLEARSLILATGARRRRLEAPGAERLRGKGVSDSPTRDLELARGKVVGIVGGGDAALENALLLADACTAVHLIHRRGTFRGRTGFRERLERRDNVTFHMETVVEAVLGDRWTSGVRLRGPRGVEDLSLDMLFVKIGVVPCSELARGQVQLDRKGYVIVGADQQTSVPGVFAIGDVCNPVYSSIAHAVGQGMVAAKTIEMILSK